MSEQHPEQGYGSWDGGERPPAADQQGGGYQPIGDNQAANAAGGGPEPAAGAATGAAPGPAGWDVLGSAVDVTPAPDAVQGGGRARRPRVLVAGSVLAVAALVLAGAGVKRFVSFASDPGSAAAHAPASSFAFAQVHLDPSASQKLALFNLSRKFPGSPTNRTGAAADDVRDILLKDLFEQPGSPVVYDADIKPWLGDYAAAAGFADDAGKPQGVVILAVKDRSAATTTFERLQKTGKGAYAFDGDYALLAADAHALAAARAQLAKGALGDDDTFRHDMAGLPSGELAVSWLDLGKFADVVHVGSCGWFGGSAATYGKVSAGAGSAAPGDSGTMSDAGAPVDAGTPVGSGTPLGSLPGAIGTCELGQLRHWLTADKSAGGGSGRLVAGVDVSGTAIDFDLRVPGAATGDGADVSSALAHLPDDTSVAVALGNPGDLLTKRGAMLGSMPWMVPPPGDTVPDTDPYEAMQRQIREATGLAFPDDFAAVLGDRAVLSVGQVPHGAASDQVPQFVLRTHPADTARARTLADRLAARLTDPELSVTTDGGDLLLADDPAYAKQVVAGGRLGDTPGYRAAMGDTSHATFAAYVDLRGLGVSSHEVPVSAVGVVEHYDGADAVVTVRVVTD